ncbi:MULTISPECIES: UDP-N-acetylmuramate dehydrogenase [Bacillaceae]|uniref:UDP-N-acetylenolpyruvoylglucosamine reductase n=1 Tax=Evansella alkalicola TaxID=745819 RepID=A0ABS6JPH6_9BACI|nr:MULTISPECIES: UDP-N-acetylmuramate dehydrogenase [Bacillaceae]MBU9720440.1 UDP-N-acetylmuramate dehydrogenase [Bacillus alkalicola]
MIDLKKKLQDLNVGRITENEPLKNHTTWKIGGPAQIFFEPDSIEGLKKGMSAIADADVPWFVLGKGSNLLISDKGLEGVVIKMGDNLTHLEEDGETITVGAGYSLIKLATIMSKKGLSGLEFAGGIPGSVGGAVFMNAGAHGSDISNILVKAHVLMPDGTLKWLSKDDMDFSYRTSRLQNDGGVCVEAIFKLTTGDKDTIKQELQANKEYRRNTQPWNYPCCGSVFRNPLPQHAGKLIEESGLKGFSIGDAQISEMHANFIVNKGEATAQNVIDLIQHIQQTIYEKYQVTLETEVERIGN